ncbi:MAG: phosphoenolpyruvate mutase [bacterium]
MENARRLRELLENDELNFFMEAHNGLSAKIVSESGFDGIWGSGLSISAAHGVRDNNELSWSQVLDQVEFMVDAASVPILLDGDTGFGNFNNMRRLVKKLEQRKVAGVCIEDKEFPKTNSFIQSEKQPLADQHEFAGKIQAGKDARETEDFCIVARIEAFIAGWGLEEALHRAELYADAGADAILVHSKKSKPEDIIKFTDNWKRDLPLVIVPTTYYSTPVQVYREAGISLAIWGNHNLRSAISAMQKTTRQIYEDKTPVNVVDEIAPVEEIFRLQEARELMEAERRYLPERSTDYRALILAATRGEELADLTRDRPKAMVEVGGDPILHKLSDRLKRFEITDQVVVRGYKKEKIEVEEMRFIDTEDYEGAGELVSLRAARSELEGALVISYGDILFRQYILNNLLLEEGEVAIAVDAAFEEKKAGGDYRDLVEATRAYSLRYSEQPVELEKMDPDLDPVEADGEWIGLLKATGEGTKKIKQALDELAEEADNFRQLRFKDLFNRLVEDGTTVNILYVTGHWVDVDTLEDLSEAQDFGS